MKLEKEIRHPSFGRIGWSRIQGQKENFFMSSLTHQGWVEITIRGAHQTIREGETWVHSTGDPHHVTVQMTEAQFAAFITTPNRMEGIPCTITRLGKTAVAPCPEDEQMVHFKQELYSKANEALEQTKEALQAVKGLLKPKASIKKADLRAVQTKLETTLRELGANLPFLVEKFNEYMEGVYHDAAARFEGYLRGRARELGINVLKGKSEESIRPITAIPLLETNQ